MVGERPSELDSLELWRPFAVSDCTDDPFVLQLLPQSSVAEQKSASTHVASAYEGRWKKQTLTEHGREGVAVFAGRDAAEKHDRGIVSDLTCELLSVLPERRDIPFARCCQIDI